MSARSLAAGLACALLAGGCGASSGLRVENSGHSVRVTTSASPAPRVRSLAAVAFPTASHGWAAGKGAIIATADGGRTWTQQYRGPADISVLEFSDDRDGWAVAAASLLRTTDGGATWSTGRASRTGASSPPWTSSAPRAAGALRNKPGSPNRRTWAKPWCAPPTAE